jgi:uncharacterized protein
MDQISVWRDSCFPRALSGRYPLWMITFLVLAVAVGLTGRVARAQEGYPQRKDTPVNDYAKLLTVDDAADTWMLLADLKRETGIEAIVVTIDSIGYYDTGDETVEAFATNLFNAWGIGDREREDGVLILVSVKDRAVRIELGSGLRGYSSDMQRVIDEHMLPSFERGDYSSGIREGVQAVVDVLADAELSEHTPTSRPASDIEPTPLPVDAGSANLGGLNAIAVVSGAATLAGGAAFGLKQYLRYRRRRCPNCQAVMARLDKGSAEAYLDDGQKAEVSLNAMDYDVWQCPSCGEREVHGYRRWFSPVKKCPHCGYRTQIRLDENAAKKYLDAGQRKEQSLGSVGYIVRECSHCGKHEMRRLIRGSASIKRCPECGYLTLVVTSKVVVKPTCSSTGKRRIVEKCRHCKYLDTKTETIPRQTYQPNYGYGGYGGYSSSSSSSSDSSSSSSGGGRSSGDGASGRW